MTQLLIINGTIINSDSSQNSDIAVSEGLIKEIGQLNPSDFPDYKIIDAKGKYIFPGGELLHISKVMTHLARSGLEMVDIENLRPHYARTLWDWSIALERQLDKARQALTASTTPCNAEKILRAYRVYLAGSAVSFEQRWLGLHQLLAIRPSNTLTYCRLKGAQSAYPFTRDYMYRS